MAEKATNLSFLVAIKLKIDQFNKAIKEAESTLKNSFKAMGDNAAVFNKKMGGVAAGLEKLGDATDSIEQSGKLVAGLGAASTLVAAAFVKATADAAEFERAMSRVVAVTDGAIKGYEALEQEAFRLGQTTRFTAIEVTEAMRLLGMVGFHATEVANAISPIVDLARAAGLGLKKAAHIGASAMRSFALPVEELAHIGDVLARTAAQSNTEVYQMADAFKYTAPIAGAAGVQIEALAAAVGVIGDAGIQASLAGTGLRAMILALVAPTKQATKVLNQLHVQVALNADGSLNLVETFKRLQAAGMGAAQATGIFNKRAAASALALSRGIEKFEELTEAAKLSVGASAEMARIMEDNVLGAAKRLTSALEVLRIQIGKSFLVPARGLLEYLKEVTVSATSLAERFPKLIAGVGYLSAAFSGLIAVTTGIALFKWFTKIVPIQAAIMGVAGAIKGLVLTLLRFIGVGAAVGALKIFTAGFWLAIGGFFLTPVGWITALTAAVLGATYAMGGFAKTTKQKLREATKEISKFKKAVTAFDAITKAIKIAGEGSKYAKENYKRLKDDLILLSKTFKGDLSESALKAAESINAVAGVAEGSGEAIKQFGKDLKGALSDELIQSLKTASEEVEAIMGFVKDQESLTGFAKLWNSLQKFMHAGAESSKELEQALDLVQKAALQVAEVYVKLGKDMGISIKSSSVEFAKFLKIYTSLSPDVVEQVVEGFEALQKKIKETKQAALPGDILDKGLADMTEAVSDYQNVLKVLQKDYKSLGKEVIKVDDKILDRAEHKIDIEKRLAIAEQKRWGLYDAVYEEEQQNIEDLAKAEKLRIEGTAKLKANASDQEIAAGKRLIELSKKYFKGVEDRALSAIEGGVEFVQDYEEALRTSIKGQDTILSFEATLVKTQYDNARKKVESLKKVLSTIQNLVDNAGQLKLYVDEEYLAAALQRIKVFRDYELENVLYKDFSILGEIDIKMVTAEELLRTRDAIKDIDEVVKGYQPLEISAINFKPEDTKNIERLKDQIEEMGGVLKKVGTEYVIEIDGTKAKELIYLINGYLKETEKLATFPKTVKVDTAEAVTNLKKVKVAANEAEEAVKKVSSKGAPIILDESVEAAKKSREVYRANQVEIQKAAKAMAALREQGKTPFLKSVTDASGKLKIIVTDIKEVGKALSVADEAGKALKWTLNVAKEAAQDLSKEGISLSVKKFEDKLLKRQLFDLKDSIAKDFGLVEFPLRLTFSKIEDAVFKKLDKDLQKKFLPHTLITIKIDRAKLEYAEKKLAAIEKYKELSVDIKFSSDAVEKVVAFKEELEKSKLAMEGLQAWDKAVSGVKEFGEKIKVAGASFKEIVIAKTKLLNIVLPEIEPLEIIVIPPEKDKLIKGAAWVLNDINVGFQKFFGWTERQWNRYGEFMKPADDAVNSLLSDMTLGLSRANAYAWEEFKLLGKNIESVFKGTLTTITEIGKYWERITAQMQEYSSSNPIDVQADLSTILPDFSKILKAMQDLAAAADIKVTITKEIITKTSDSVKKAFGGILAGYGGGDRIPAMLEAGEGVIRKEAVRHYGQSFINLVNSMQYRISELPGQLSRQVARVTMPIQMQTGGIVPSFPDMGIVKLQVGPQLFPVIAQPDVIKELTEALEKEKLLRNN